MKASFPTRMLAYLLDGLLILIVTSLITMSFKENKKLDEYNTQLQDIMSEYTTGQMTMEDYLQSTTDLTYNINRESVVTNSISLLVTIMYFTVFQFLNKGQTIGKRLFRIKVIEDNKEPSFKAILIRSFIINGIIVSLLDIIFVSFLEKSNYFYVSTIINYLYYGIIIASSLMILYRKDKRGLQDIIARTEVINERG